MKKTHEEKVEAILRYQQAKKELSIKCLDIDLIPNEVMIKKEELTEEKVDLVIDRFEADEDLHGSNCIHCLVHEVNCEKCPYFTILGEKCDNPDSLFIKALLEAADTSDKSYYFSERLLKVGKELSESIGVDASIPWEPIRYLED